MADLKLKYIDGDGSSISFEADEPFVTIGRHSDNTIVISDSRLSREHLILEREGSAWFAEDRGSSNGTTVNGEPLLEQKRLKDGDRLSLGGFEMEVTLAAAAIEPSAAPPVPQASPNAAAPASAPSVAPAANASASPLRSFLFIAPLLGMLVIIIAVGFLFLHKGDKPKDDPIAFGGPTPETDSTPVRSSGPVPDSTPTNTAADTPSGTPLKEDTQAVKVEKFTAQFMRKAAKNDPRFFLSSAQAAEVAKRISSMSGPVKANLPSLAKSSAEINKLAADNGLDPDFLAAAALAKLGTSRGDALSTARSMAGVFAKLTIPIGNELGDDCLLMMAAYDQGEAGDFMKLRNLLQDLATRSNAPIREIRSIWFLNKSGKITPQEYELALRFLAAGAIMQDPASF